jgi:rSAM/selenodomain-associated transferase 2
MRSEIMQVPKIAIIVPTLNESARIATMLSNLRTQGDVEILVVDGGSTDDTVLLSAGADLVLASQQGRAAQMNFGAAHATADWFVFLHADCMLEAGALAEAWRIAQRPGVAAVCFHQHTDDSNIVYRMIDRSATLRAERLGLPYGDQGLFLSAQSFRAVGGFPGIGFMEDVFLALKLRRMGRIVVTSRTIQVSARRWQRIGPIRQTLRNWTLTALALLGVPPDRLAQFYPQVR